MTVQITDTRLPEVKLLEPAAFGDSRGFFMELYHSRCYAELGLPGEFVQDNFSRSVRGVLRGLHYQLRHPQGKLVSVLDGAVFDVAVDIRRGSPTFGQWIGEVLSADNRRQIYIPPGFAHGFCVLSDTAGFLYKCTEFYHPEDDRGVNWADVALGIDWPIRDPMLSKKDRALPTLKEVPADSLPGYLTR